MSVFDLPLRLLSNLPIIGGSGGRDEEERDEGPVDDGDEDVAAADDHDEEPADDVADAPAAAADEPDGEDGGDDAGGDDEDISEITAPSIGPHTTFENDASPQERLARHEQSDVDAMGLEKRREVIGGSYSASITRQLATYGIVLAVIGAIVVGFVLLAHKLDAAPDKYQDKAPWSQADAKQIKPTEIDFPNYGHPGPGDSSQSTPGQSAGASSSQNVAESQN